MLTLHESFYRLLNERGFSPSRIVRVESAGDAGTPDVEILWVDAKKRPQRAYVCKPLQADDALRQAGMGRLRLIETFSLCPLRAAVVEPPFG